MLLNHVIYAGLLCVQSIGVIYFNVVRALVIDVVALLVVLLVVFLLVFKGRWRNTGLKRGRLDEMVPPGEGEPGLPLWETSVIF